MAINKIILEKDGLVVGNTQLVASGSGISVGGLSVTGNSSFTGNLSLAGSTNGSVVLQAPAIAGSSTLTLPAATGTILSTAGGQTISGTTTVSTLNAATVQVNGSQALNGPAFSAWQSSIQSISNNTQVKIQFQTKEFDTANCYDNTTNYRFTPNVAGYYQVNSGIRLEGASGTSEIMISIFKNGSQYRRSWNLSGVQIASNFWQMTLSFMMYLNGTTDYIEAYAFHNSGSAKNSTASIDNTYFQACFLRGV